MYAASACAPPCAIFQRHHHDARADDTPRTQRAAAAKSLMPPRAAPPLFTRRAIAVTRARFCAPATLPPPLPLLSRQIDDMPLFYAFTAALRHYIRRCRLFWFIERCRDDMIRLMIIFITIDDALRFIDNTTMTITKHWLIWLIAVYFHAFTVFTFPSLPLTLFFENITPRIIYHADAVIVYL